jgi:hypothetical protein
MRMFAAAMVLAVAFASPALAKSTHHSKPKPAARVVVRPAPQFPGYPAYNVHHRSYDVYVDGNYAGSDPDPRVRYQLEQEYRQNEMDNDFF